MKPKTNRTGKGDKSNEYDRCQTPPYAVTPLLPYLPREWVIWESARGEGYLQSALENRGYRVVGTDILTGQNFFDTQPPQGVDCLITNPPYSNPVKFQWIERCYALRLPFALLMPVEVIGAKRAQAQFKAHGVEVVWLSHRVNFKMPSKGWNSKAQFPVAWFTWGLNIGCPMTFAPIDNKTPISQLPLFRFS